MMTEQLKKRERAILEYMQGEIERKGYPPTVREVCKALGIKSTSTAHKDIENLVKKGYIIKDPSKPRALMIKNQMAAGAAGQNSKSSYSGYKNAAGLQGGNGAVSRSSENLQKNLGEREDVVDVPVVGRISAGTPVLAEQNLDDTFPLPARYVGRGTCFMLTVHGESMIEAGIYDGDYILVEQQNTAKNGDIVVAMIDGFESEATVKTFYREADHIRLQPENSSMNPILVKDVKILGKVKGVFRYFN